MPNLEELYSKYFKIIYKFLLAKTNNPELAEDLTQETFYYAVRDINKFKGNCKLSVWLCQISKNLLYKEYNKKRKALNIISDDISPEIPSIYNVEEEIIEKENKKDLYYNINKLDEVTKEVIVLRIQEEKTFKEIANFFGKSEVWARVTFYRGKEKLMEGKEDEK